jgi:alkylation response protein AidB-like acyl-CoA dehydrogenase
VQSIRTTAVRDGDHYVVNGSKMFITNARTATLYALAVKTDPKASPSHRGISMLVAERDAPGVTVGRDIEKLGYKSVETCEVSFEDARVPASHLIGGAEGHGFQQVMSALEVGRINVAARAVGVAQAAFDDAIRYAQQRTTFGKPICEHQAVQLRLADMATAVEAARLLVRRAAELKGPRRARRRRGRYGQAVRLRDLPEGQPGRDARAGWLRLHERVPGRALLPRRALMLIGEGTSDIQRLVIARGLIQRNRI